MGYNLVLTALADRTRRNVLNRLRMEPKSASQIAKTMKISRPAVTQHLRKLLRADLVGAEVHGRNTLYFLTRRGFDDLEDYLAGFNGLKGFRRPTI